MVNQSILSVQFGYVFIVIATSLKNFFFFISLEKVVYIKSPIGKKKHQSDTMKMMSNR
jgi:hypothetical protein